MFEYFYNEIFRKTIIGFGSLFNKIEIKKTNDLGEITSVTKVPLSYGPTQKFLARITENPSLNKEVQITLPRMSFELVGIRYDSTRKATQTQTFLTTLKSNSNEIKKAYLPVPYNLDFELSIFTKFNDDMLQIVEQILPYFQPAYTLTINLVNDIGEKRDIPVIFEGISMQDDYEGDYNTRRALIYTLNFTAKTYIFGPVSTASSDIIKKSTISLVSGDVGGGSRIKEVSYSVEPKATKSYTNNVVATLLEDIDISKTEINVSDGSQFEVNSRITIGEETLLVKEINSNSLMVERGYFSTNRYQHLSGAEIKLITDSDDLLIDPDDNFGFSGSIF
jgi:hypothetical protein